MIDMVKQVMKWICIVIMVLFTILGMQTAFKYGQQLNLFLVWISTIPLMAFTWYLFVRIFDKSKKGMKQIFTVNTVPPIIAASLVMACEVIYSSF